MTTDLVIALSAMLASACTLTGLITYALTVRMVEDRIEDVADVLELQHRMDEAGERNTVRQLARRAYKS